MLNIVSMGLGWGSIGTRLGVGPCHVKISIAAVSVL